MQLCCQLNPENKVRECVCSGCLGMQWHVCLELQYIAVPHRLEIRFLTLCGNELSHIWLFIIIDMTLQCKWVQLRVWNFLEWRKKHALCMPGVPYILLQLSVKLFQDCFASFCQFITWAIPFFDVFKCV